MALTNNGTKLSIPSEDRPEGYTRSAPTKFTEELIIRDLQLTINKSDVEAAAAGDALDDIIDDVAVGIDKQVEDYITARFDTTTYDVTTWINFKQIVFNQSRQQAAFYTNATPAYTCTVDVYVLTALA